jgi:hypothetical protein
MVTMMVLCARRHDAKKIRDARNFVKRDVADRERPFVELWGFFVESQGLEIELHRSTTNAEVDIEHRNEVRKARRASMMTLDNDKISFALKC